MLIRWKSKDKNAQNNNNTNNSNSKKKRKGGREGGKDLKIKIYKNLLLKENY